MISLESPLSSVCMDASFFFKFKFKASSLVEELQVLLFCDGHLPDPPLGFPDAAGCSPHTQMPHFCPRSLLPPLWDKFHTTLGPVVQILLSSSSSSGNQPHPTTSLVVGHSCLAAAQASPAAFICHKAPGLNHHRREHRELHLNLQTNSTPNNTDMFTLKTEP